MCKKVCHTKLEADVGDLRWQTSTGGSYDFSPAYFYVTCPDCQQRIVVADADVPASQAVKLRLASSNYP